MLKGLMAVGARFPETPYVTGGIPTDRELSFRINGCMGNGAFDLRWRKALAGGVSLSGLLPNLALAVPFPSSAFRRWLQR